MRPRAVFMGTPEFAVPSLHALHSIADVVAVVCQPDRPAGRGVTKPVAPPVKEAALALGLPVHQPEKVKDGTFAAWLRERSPDVALVVAYGRILPGEVLAIPKHGCVNVHASLLPRHRGAAPINWAIIAGDERTGITLMQMDEGMDTGPMLATSETAIDPEETSEELYQRLSKMGAELVQQKLLDHLAGKLPPIAQNHALATAAPMLTKELGKIDWTRSAQAVHNHVRGLQPWPVAYTFLGTRRLIVHKTTIHDAPKLLAGAPGEVVSVTKDRVWVATGEGALGLVEVQSEGKKRSSVRDFLAGHPLRTGTMFSSP